MQETEECHGGPNFGHSKGTAEMKSSTLFPSTLTDSSLHHNVVDYPKRCLEEKHHFQIGIRFVRKTVKQSETMSGQAGK